MFFPKEQYGISFRKAFIIGLLLLVIFPAFLSAQNKTKKKIDIENADIMLYDEAVVKNAQRLIGNVLLTHNNMVMRCDSAWKYANTNAVDAFGNVHILSNDTLNLWASQIHYNGDSGLAKARKKVKLQDPTLTLFTDSLDFDLNENIGYYKHGGKIVDSTNTLNSTTGTYFTRNKEVHFITNVRLMNDEYTLRTDTLIYNTETQIAFFEGPTNIVGDSTQIFSNNGWFNTQTNESELTRNSTIKRGETQLQANFIYYNDETGEGYARDQIVINDFENQMIITGNNAKYSDFNRNAMVTDSAVWIQYYEGDSLFLHADTLYTIPDTTADNAKMLITYQNVRFYRSDIQGICDSLIYYTKDSTIQLYRDPVMWSSENQLSSDFIELLSNAEPPNEVYLKNNAFIIQQVDSSKFNQIKGKNMVGLIKGETLYRIDVNGNGQSIYFPADDDDYIGINKAESSNIILYLSENQINRITFVGATTGNLKPMIEIVPADSKLEGFIWREEERPVNRFDIFGNKAPEEQPETLPSGTIENILPDLETAKEAIQPETSDSSSLDFESELPEESQ
jgi:lipopolysaccharide export system protein LptA